MDKSKRHLAWWGVGALAVAAVVAWLLLRPAGVPEGFAGATPKRNSCRTVAG